MMSITNWLVLLVIYVAYLVLGMFLFNMTECPKELETKRQKSIRYQHISEAINQLKLIDNPETLALLHDIFSYTEGRNSENGTIVACTKWNLHNSLFFAFTVVTTIGYGHQAPETEQGRIWCLIYAIIGVPLNAILIGALGSVFSNKLVKLKNKTWKSLGSEDGDEKPKKPRVFVVMAEGLVFISFFCTIFIFLPSLVFHILEYNEEGSWTYLDSFYFAFITLSTIGFGDIVPARQENEHIPHQFGKMTYLLGIIIWIIFGMGFIFGMVDVISGTLRATSKPVKKAFKGLKNQLQDNDYWRKIISEIIMLKNGGENSSGDSGDGFTILTDMVGGGGGGSEPCLGDMEGMDNQVIRKSVSTGNVDVTDSDRGLIVDPGLLMSSALQNPNFLSVPGGGRPTIMVNSLSETQLEELNEDTITSLRHFLTQAQIATPVWIENNIPVIKSAPNKSTSLLGIDKGNYLTVGSSGDNGRPGLQQVRRSSMQSTKLSMSRKNSVSKKSATSIGGEVGQLLEQTSLGEFLTAVENVRKKSMVELDKPPEDYTNRRPSMMRRLSQFSMGRTSNDVQGILPSISNMFSIDREGTNKSASSLISDIPTSSSGSPQSNKSTVLIVEQDDQYTQHI